MLDEIFDLFDRDDRKRGNAPKQGGVRGLLNRFGGDDDQRDDDDTRKRHDVDDDREDHRSNPKKKRREFDFFGDD